MLLLTPCSGLAAEGASAVGPELREQSISVLRRTLHETDGWVKVHAAELLIGNNYVEEARAAFEAELEKDPAPPFRIGVWRVLIQAAGNDQELRRQYLDKIVAAFLDSAGTDRVHAVETLGKLGYAERSPELKRVAEEGEGSFQAYARWVVANSGEAEDEALLAELLDAGDSDVRGCAAYALRYFNVIRDDTFEKLSQALSREPEGSSGRVYLVSALYVHDKGNDYSRHRQEGKVALLEYLETGNKDEKNEACAALAEVGGADDVGILTTLLQDPETDVQAHAANALFRIGRRESRGLSWPDWTVIALYGAFMLGFGCYFLRKQTSTEEYFLASRNMNPNLIGISMFATLLSTISYLGSPGEVIKHGPMSAVGNILIMPFVYLVAGYILIPAVMRLKITSAYEILEARLGVQVRVLGAVLFMMTRLVWMAMLTYIAAKLLVEMLDWSEQRIPWVVVVMGLVAVVYTALGGLRAVIITDLFQFVFLVGGAILTVVLITVEMGGFGWVPTQWAPHWDVQPLFSWNFTTRVTMFGAMAATFCWWICTAGSDQVAIQRYLATRDAKSARRAFLVNAIADVGVMILLYLVGFALLGLFLAQPHMIPDGRSPIEGADYLFPRYIANYLPIGVAGLVIAAMFAAAMSSLDSGINSIVTVISKDFIDRFRRKKGRDGEVPTINVRLARILALLIGIAVVLLSSLIGIVPGNIIEVTNKTNGLFIGPLFCLFVLALFIPGSTSFGTIIGAVYGFTTAFTYAYWDALTGGSHALSFQWILPAALVVNLLVGVSLSRVPTRGRTRGTIIAWGVIALAPLVVLYAWLFS
jgi:SSS family solute:Na+ symporter